MKTIAIIGAGPAGNYAAELLAKQGNDVHVFEEHIIIGEPWQCTGIITSSVNDVLKVDEKAIVNNIGTIRIYSPNNNFIDFKMRRHNIILDRAKYDRILAERAKKAGAKYHLNSRFSGFERKGKKLVLNIQTKKDGSRKATNTIHEFECDYLIGADGPTSSVAKAAGMFGKREFYQGVQARIKLKNSNIVETFPDIGAFSWIVPENKSIARVGVITNRNSKKDFDALLEKVKEIKKLKAIKIIDRQAGIVPVYNQRIRIEKTIGKGKAANKIFLIGDAAVQVKATTFGGIIHGLIAAECLAKSISKGKSYQTLCNSRLKKDLWLSLKIRNSLNKMHARDYNQLVALMKKDKARKVLEKEDRDFPSKFLLKLLMAEPRLVLFARKLF